MSLAGNGPKLFHKNLTVSRQISILHLNNRSSMLRLSGGNQTNIMTTKRIISGEELK